MSWWRAGTVHLGALSRHLAYQYPSTPAIHDARALPSVFAEKLQVVCWLFKGDSRKSSRMVGLCSSNSTRLFSNFNPKPTAADFGSLAGITLLLDSPTYVARKGVPQTISSFFHAVLLAIRRCCGGIIVHPMIPIREEIRILLAIALKLTAGTTCGTTATTISVF